MNRATFRETLRKIVTIATVAASWTPTNKDDQAVALVASLVEDDDKFNAFCDILGLPE